MQQGTEPSWLILKFGGSSVSKAKHWKNIASIVAARINAGYRPLLVLSALKNVSNLLEAILHQSISGVHPAAIAQLKTLHFNFSSQLSIDVESKLTPWFDKLEKICSSIFNEQQITPKNHASVLAIGELLSTTIGALFLTQYFSDQYKENVHWLDARKLLVSLEQTDQRHHFTNAQCDYTFDLKLKKYLSQYQGTIITQGFIATDSQHNTVLLGREGSDTSAAYFGAKLNAKKIEIWTDVPGIFSANPREIPQAKQLSQLSYQQAKNLSQLGAKVLHPRAVQPAEKNRIPLLISCTYLPFENGTQINTSIQKQSDSGVMAIVNAPEVTWLHFNHEIGNEVSKPDELSMLKKIEPLGFDLVFSHEEPDATHLILRYNNSDNPYPHINKLKKQFPQYYTDKNQPQIIPQLGLISIVGKISKDAFLRQIGSLNESREIVKVFENHTNSAICLLISKQLTTSLGKKLHKIFIENKKNHLMGKNWLSYPIG